jgi:putative solute:sodium symporter small subunit
MGSDGPGAGKARSNADQYWRANIRWLALLLGIWALVSFGFGILLVEPLNNFKIGGAPLGFWFAQQGSIYVFVVLITVYVIVMNRLDRRFGYRED